MAKSKHKQPKQTEESDLQDDQCLEGQVEPELERDPDALLRRCEELTEQRAQLAGRHQRALADLQNYQKRVARERDELIQRTKVETIEQILFPVIDDLDRAIEAANTHGYNADDPLFAGLTMVHKRMFELLKQYGIEPIEAEGAPFDPLYHQAVMEQPSGDRPDGTVLQVLSRGYVADGKTIRPARVVVAKSTENEQPQQGDGAKDSEDNGDADI